MYQHRCRSQCILYCPRWAHYPESGGRYSASAQDTALLLGDVADALWLPLNLWRCLFRTVQTATLPHPNLKRLDHSSTSTVMIAILTSIIVQGKASGQTNTSIAVMNRLIKAKGKRNFQASAINWSILTRGSVVRVQTITKNLLLKFKLIILHTVPAREETKKVLNKRLQNRLY